MPDTAVVTDVGQRNPRVRFKHPVRVASQGAEPRVFRTWTANLSPRGLFLRMPEPLTAGTRVAISLEAGGQTLAFAEGEVVWCRTRESQLPGRYPGSGVRFERFLHPRAHELVNYLVANLDRGRPLKAAPRPRNWRRLGLAAAAVAGLSLSAAAVFFLSQPGPATPPLWDPVLGEAARPTPGVATALVDVPTPVEAVALVADAGAPEAVAVAVAEDPVVAPPLVEASPEEVIDPADLEPATEDAGEVDAQASADPVPEDLPPATADEQRGSVALPSGAVQTVSWALAFHELRVAIGGGTLKRHFMLAGPPRVVFDVEGAAPRMSHTVNMGAMAGSTPFIKRVRVGRQNDSTTRVVLDLARFPRDVSDDGEAVILSF